jgi:Mn2+/Fe2+ NRAMP family transporter
MILLFSVVGIFVLFALKYFIDKKDNANIKVKEFIVSKKFLETVTELIVIILGATIAINFTNIQEKKENKQRTIALLEATKSEIEESYNLNSAFI